LDEVVGFHDNIISYVVMSVNRRLSAG
jgi:hypothetical protein